MRRATISHAAMAAADWKRVDPRPWRKLSARWNHAGGWRLEHCGHPTANHPWALYDPEGRMHLTGGAGPKGDAELGTAWNTLQEAMAYVRDQLAGARRGHLSRVPTRRERKHNR